VSCSATKGIGSSWCFLHEFDHKYFSFNSFGETAPVTGQASHDKLHVAILIPGIYPLVEDSRWQNLGPGVDEIRMSSNTTLGRLALIVRYHADGRLTAMVFKSASQGTDVLVARGEQRFSARQGNLFAVVADENGYPTFVQAAGHLFLSHRWTSSQSGTDDPEGNTLAAFEGLLVATQASNDELTQQGVRTALDKIKEFKARRATLAGNAQAPTSSVLP
jgi:hypothetical protein